MAEQDQSAAQASNSDAAACCIPSASGDKEKSVRTAIVGSSIVLWILAIFMINILYSINGSLSELTRSMEVMMSITSRQNLESYQLVDAKGEPVFSFRVNPEHELMVHEALPEEEK